MAWGSELSLGTGQTAIADTWTDLAAASFQPSNAYDLVHVQVAANSSGTPTDALEIRVLSTTGTDDDDSPVFAMSFDPSSTSQEFVSFTISGYYGFKVQVQSAGATDTYDVTGSHARVFSN